ncbi:MAG: hypothetical protein LBI82_11230, partial [Dysgonamonadaceae bacterium]|nr:hypothetical protein [Dysgonamonadaceae bacterium]
GLNSLTYAKVQNLKQNKRKIVFFTMIMLLRRRATVDLVQQPRWLQAGDSTSGHGQNTER